MKRLCERCETPLPGKKRHGFVVKDGKAVWCRMCTNPPKAKPGGYKK